MALRLYEELMRPVVRRYFEGNQSYLRDVFAKMSSAQLFECDDALQSDEFVLTAQEAAKAEIFPMPSENAVFEWQPDADMRVLVLTWKSPSADHVLCAAGFSWIGSQVGVFPGVPLMDLTTSGIVGMAFPTTPTDEQISAAEGAWPHMLNCVVSFIMAMQCRDVLVHDCGPSPRVRRKREAKGLEPLIEYRKVIVKEELRAVYEAAAKHAHASPRFHFRRGHVRTCHSGIKTLVSPCYVGSIERGEIKKTYEVRH